MSKSTRRTIFALAAVAAIFVSGYIAGNFSGRRITDRRIMRVVGALPGGKVMEAMSLIGCDYVDSISVDSLSEVAVSALLDALDPHSVYIPARDLEKTDEPLQGEFDGIGVVFNMATDTVIVLNVVPSGPSQKAGVMGGDRIIKVNDTLIAGQKLSTDDVMGRLRGRRGTKVRLSLERRGIDSPVEVEVTRAAIPLHSVEAAVMLTARTGFVKLSQFSRTSFAELSSAIERLRGEGMRGLVLDLRGNSGGFLDQAILIANEFLPKDHLIVYTEDRRHSRIHQYSDGRGKCTDLAVAVLIDEGSASSSEILAGALQDNDRGTIVGRRSFGKGLVQTQVPFSDGSAMRLTVARYFTPTGRSIQKPYTGGSSDDYEMDIVNRFYHNEFFSADSIRFADSLRFTTPGGRTVYGGGGIMPDVFMSLDTTNVTKYFAEVSGRNILLRYTIDYADRRRGALGAARNTADLRRLFEGDPHMFDRFIDYAAAQGVEPEPREIERSKAIMDAQLKALVARNSELDNSAFYYFIYPVDTTMKRAVAIVEEELDRAPER